MRLFISLTLGQRILNPPGLLPEQLPQSLFGEIQFVTGKVIYEFVQEYL